MAGSRRNVALPLRPVRDFDGSRKFNPRTCWDAEEASSRKAFATSRTSAGSRIDCQTSFKPDDKFILSSCTPQSAAEMGLSDTCANKFWKLLCRHFKSEGIWGMLFTSTWTLGTRYALLLELYYYFSRGMPFFPPLCCATKRSLKRVACGAVGVRLAGEAFWYELIMWRGGCWDGT